jgi:hypothetical protein
MAFAIGLRPSRFLRDRGRIKATISVVPEGGQVVVRL